MHFIKQTPSDLNKHIIRLKRIEPSISVNETLNQEPNSENQLLKVNIQGPIKLTSQALGFSINISSLEFMLLNSTPAFSKEILKGIIDWMKEKDCF